jgi:hypothetical protein
LSPSRIRTNLIATTFFPVLLAIPTVAAAQQVAPPEAQAWIDIATFSGMGMPMGGMSGMGGAGRHVRGQGSRWWQYLWQHAQHERRRWVDVTVRARANPNLDAAQQAVPEGFLSPALELRTPKNAPPAPVRDDEDIKHEDPERPKGRMLLYWGCGASVRAGSAQGARHGDRGARRFRQVLRRPQRHAARRAQRGRTSVMAESDDARMVPETASLQGEHAFSGKGIPAAFRFRIPAAQDLMPPIKLDQAARDGATELKWNAIATARAYFVSAMGSNEKEDMVMWTSSELADTGFGLMDYQTNVAVDRWLKEKVLLTPQTTTCTVPKGIFGENGGMLRVIAYGDELNLAHPPRPKDPKAKWEPVWAVKLRVKSVTNGMLGMSEEGRPGRSGSAREQGDARSERRRSSEESPDELKLEKPLELLKGIFGR